MLPIELPTFEATWCPVMLETVPGSGTAACIYLPPRSVRRSA